MKAFSLSDTLIKGVWRSFGIQWFVFDQCSWNLLKMRISGPVEGPRHTPKASAKALQTWCRQAIHSKFRPIADSRREHAPFILPVLQAVVSKHIPMMSFSDCHDCRSSKTTSAAALPEPEVNFGTPRSFVLPSISEVIRTDSRSTLWILSPVKSGGSFPSQWTIDLLKLKSICICCANSWRLCYLWRWTVLLESTAADVEHPTSLTNKARIMVDVRTLVFVRSSTAATFSDTICLRLICSVSLLVADSAEAVDANS